MLSTLPKSDFVFVIGRVNRRIKRSWHKCFSVVLTDSRQSDYIRDGGSLELLFPIELSAREVGADRVDQTNYLHSDGREDLVGAD